MRVKRQERTDAGILGMTPRVSHCNRHQPQRATVKQRGDAVSEIIINRRLATRVIKLQPRLQRRLLVNLIRSRGRERERERNKWREGQMKKRRKGEVGRSCSRFTVETTRVPNGSRSRCPDRKIREQLVKMYSNPSFEVRNSYRRPSAHDVSSLPQDCLTDYFPFYCC